MLESAISDAKNDFFEIGSPPVASVAHKLFRHHSFVLGLPVAEIFHNRAGPIDVRKTWPVGAPGLVQRAPERLDRTAFKTLHQFRDHLRTLCATNESRDQVLSKGLAGYLILEIIKRRAARSSPLSAAKHEDFVERFFADVIRTGSFASVNELVHDISSAHAPPSIRPAPHEVVPAGILPVLPLFPSLLPSLLLPLFLDYTSSVKLDI